jgi:hypothetical protein
MKVQQKEKRREEGRRVEKRRARHLCTTPGDMRPRVDSDDAQVADQAQGVRHVPGRLRLGLGGRYVGRFGRELPLIVGSGSQGAMEGAAGKGQGRYTYLKRGVQAICPFPLGRTFTLTERRRDGRVVGYLEASRTMLS